MTNTPMNDLHLEAKSTWRIWQLGVLKTAAMLFGLAIGIYLADALRPYILLIWGLVIVFGVWSVLIWMHARKRGWLRSLRK